MSGFVATTRVERVRRHLTRIDRDRLVAFRSLALEPDEDDGIVIVERSSRAEGLTLAERWQAIRERWSQTTFYLFDADSWR